MPSRRQIRQAVIQFLYGFDLEGGADPAALRPAFWDFITESDRRALAVATSKTLHHLSLGREDRLQHLREKLPEALALLRAEPVLGEAPPLLEQINALETEWSSRLAALERVPRDDEDDTVATRLQPELDHLFHLDREISSLRHRFLQLIGEHPSVALRLESVTASLRRLSRVSQRIRMIENPETFPDHSELAKIRECRAEIATLREKADALSEAVLQHRESIDQRLRAVIENFSPERIDPVDRAILRLGAYEILHDPEVPAPVAIDEAIELAKRFGTTDSGRFVNGVLDKIAQG